MTCWVFRSAGGAGMITPCELTRHRATISLHIVVSHPTPSPYTTKPHPPPPPKCARDPAIPDTKTPDPGLRTLPPPTNPGQKSYIRPFLPSHPKTGAWGRLTRTQKTRCRANLGLALWTGWRCKGSAVFPHG